MKIAASARPDGVADGSTLSEVSVRSISGPCDQGVPERRQRVGEARKQQRIGAVARIGLPQCSERDQDDDPAHRHAVGDALQRAERARDVADVAEGFEYDFALRRAAQGACVHPWRSRMIGPRYERGFDLVGEQQAVDAPVQQVEGRAAEIGKADMAGIELGLHAAGMRRQRVCGCRPATLPRSMRDEQHREADLFPQRR